MTKGNNHLCYLLYGSLKDISWLVASSSAGQVIPPIYGAQRMASVFAIVSYTQPDEFSSYLHENKQNTQLNCQSDDRSQCHLIRKGNMERS